VSKALGSECEVAIVPLGYAVLACVLDVFDRSGGYDIPS